MPCEGYDWYQIIFFILTMLSICLTLACYVCSTYALYIWEVRFCKYCIMQHICANSVYTLNPPAL